MKNTTNFISALSLIYEKAKNNETEKFRLWEHCYNNFYIAKRNDYLNKENLSLQLACYLEGWGFKLSTFFLEKDYKIHIHAVDTILSEKYYCLVEATSKMLLEDINQELLCVLSNKLEEYYKGISSKINDKKIKKLVAAILMGTLGCIPATQVNLVDIGF